MPDRKLAVAATAAVALAVPAVALGAAKPGYYIDPANSTTVITNSSAGKVKTFQTSCMSGGTQGGTVIVKGIKIKKGKFSYSGKAQDVTAGGTVSIQVTISGKFGKSNLKGKFSSTGSPAPCDTLSYKAKYYGKHPRG